MMLFMFILISSVAAAAAVAALAPRFGVEQRPDFVERPEASR